MIWLKGNSANFNQIELVNKKQNKYAIKLSPRSYTPNNNEASINEQEDNNDIEYIEIISIGIQSVDKIKKHLLDALNEYDSSSEVNVFYFNNKTYWLDVNTRNAIYHSCELFEKSGMTMYKLWLDDVYVMLSIDNLKEFLIDLEKYAKRCYDVTAEHKAEIIKLDKIEDILNYNISLEYPDPIELDEYI